MTEVSLTLRPPCLCLPREGNKMASPHKALYGWNTFPNNARMKNHIELQSGQKWIKKIRPLPHFDDGKKWRVMVGARVHQWFWGRGGFISYFVLVVYLSCNHLSYLRFYSWMVTIFNFDCVTLQTSHKYFTLVEARLSGISIWSDFPQQ